ncbi:hypothetical protein C8J57DRAFT_1493274 [Mycena rebaudengoi]|nr:hypothetical protein C8J57DRAFT_1493274 [Mycena rebaudengoi]
MTFGNGLAVLETQAKLTAFLLGVVTTILNDVDLTHLIPAAPLPAPEIPILNTTFQWQSSARLNVLRPYGPPPVFNIDDIGILMNSQYEFTVQHLADLRTDPISFAENLQAYYEHRIETRHGKAPQSLVQGRTVSLMLTDAYAFLAYYHIAKEIIHDFRIVQANFQSGPVRARELMKEYEDALKKLHPILGLLEERVSKAHHQMIITIRSTDAAFRQHEFTFASRPDDKLNTFLTSLLQEDKTHLWQDPAAHRRISPLIASILSQWGVINDCKSILASHRPAVDATELLPAGVEQPLAARVFPISNFTYPKGPRDSTWAAKCEDVDAVFAAFWKAADRFLIKRFVLMSWSSLVAPKVPLRTMPKAAALVPFGGAEQGPEVKEEPSAPKAKPKTRGVAAITVKGKGNEQATETSVDIAPTPVSARVYKVHPRKPRRLDV